MEQRYLEIARRVVHERNERNEESPSTVVVETCSVSDCGAVAWTCSPSGSFYCYEHRGHSGLCANCAIEIPKGSTLCVSCGAQRSRLVAWALANGASAPPNSQATP